MAKNRALGKPLNALLGTPAPLKASSVKQKTATKAKIKVVEESSEKLKEFAHLPIEFLKPGRFQPRREILKEELSSLAESIKSQGVIQPIIAWAIGKNRYEIIAGERRWRAAQLAGLSAVPVVIKDIIDQSALAMALIENIQREDLNPIEEAIALDRLSREFKLTHLQVAESVGKSRAAISNLIRFLSLNDDVKLMLERRELEAGHAKVLLACKGPKQSLLAQKVKLNKLSVRETEKLLTQASPALVEAHAKRKPIDPDIRRLQTTLSERFGAGVKIDHHPKGRGKIVIQYNNLDELDGILQHWQIES